MTILTPKTAYDTTAWPDAARLAADDDAHRDHAQTIRDVLVQLLPVAPAVVNITRWSDGFNGRFGVELVLATVVDDLTAVQRAIGGFLLIEAETTISGAPCLRHTLTGTRCGVPFAAWTTVYPSVKRVAA